MQNIQRWHQFVPGPIQVIPISGSAHPLHVLRLDLIQSWASGNKYYKLKYTLRRALENNITTIVSKGGMFSNHLDALAEACHMFSIQLVCIIRTHIPDPDNPSLSRWIRLGSKIIYMDPAEYQAFDASHVASLFPEALFIPEGGLAPDGLKGAAEIGAEIETQKYRHVLIAGGTLCTAAGLLSSIPKETKLHILPAWKGCEKKYMDDVLRQYAIEPNGSWDIWPEYHFGGFGKYDQDLIQFMTDFTRETAIPLDPVYTGKLMYATVDKMKKAVFSNEAPVLVIHTGGLQGLQGYAYRFPEHWLPYATLVEGLKKVQNL